MQTSAWLGVDLWAGNHPADSTASDPVVSVTVTILMRSQLPLDTRGDSRCGALGSAGSDKGMVSKTAP